VSGALTRKGEDLLLRIKVTPGARKAMIGGHWSDADGQQSLIVKVQQPPDDGKANKAVLVALSKALKIPKSTVRVLRGQTSRNKTLLIAGADQMCEVKLQNLIRRNPG